ncbi:MAG TPA: TetR family transcriptional regulator C-terminal domain-containing protein [Candidatus Ruania gallistercoris]|uniref:TetR family transcriptional regulator C-terminal domain-containing protein n=1 Tax=Candidatus Ruania gallistercoris TaxID=2838746 RepID=A0A9D2EDY1_9MICO|nr:TetR family transcriptional regulator C-terminal domain-containing protein [Candidatus Ruania gallistercoris]
MVEDMPRRVDHDERREEIVIGVIAVMAEQGLGAVSLRSVAQAAGVSMGRVQHYFSSKSELIQHACKLFIQRATAQHGESRDMPRRERLEALLTMGLPGSADERIGTAIWYEFVTAGTKDDRIADLIAAAWRERHDNIVNLLEGSGDQRSLPPQETAELLSATSEGLAIAAMLGRISREDARSLIAKQINELGVDSP